VIQRQLHGMGYDVLRLVTREGRIQADRIDSPAVAGSQVTAVPYWGMEGGSTRSLSPLLGDELNIRLIASPWIELSAGMLVDIRNGAVRRYQSEAQAQLQRLSLVGMGPDDRTLLSVAEREDDMLDLRLVTTDTVGNLVRVIPMAPPPAFNMPRGPTGRTDVSAITLPWIVAHFNVELNPGRALDLRAHSGRTTVPHPSFVSVGDRWIGLACVRESIIPAIMDALRRNWDAMFRDGPLVNGLSLDIRCPTELGSESNAVDKTWLGRIGQTEVALGYSQGSVSLTLLDDDSDRGIGSRDTLRKATLVALHQYLNERLRRPEWQAKLVSP
jgi:hypothetical protein